MTHIWDLYVRPKVSQTIYGRILTFYPLTLGAFADCLCLCVCPRPLCLLMTKLCSQKYLGAEKLVWGREAEGFEHVSVLSRPKFLLFPGGFPTQALKS